MLSLRKGGYVFMMRAGSRMGIDMLSMELSVIGLRLKSEQIDKIKTYPVTLAWINDDLCVLENGDCIADGINTITTESCEVFVDLIASTKQTDNGVWFTDGVKWIKSDVHRFTAIPQYLYLIGMKPSKARRATPEEIISNRL